MYALSFGENAYYTTMRNTKNDNCVKITTFGGTYTFHEALFYFSRFGKKKLLTAFLVPHRRHSIPVPFMVIANKLYNIKSMCGR